MDIAKRINDLKAELPEQVTLVAVSKFHPAESIWAAYEAGQRVFGESRAQELLPKQKTLPDDIEWHFIGTLQRNKVKDIAPFISLIQSVDSYRLLEEINKEAAKHDRVIRVLLEIHVAQEDSKHGLTQNECLEMLAMTEWQSLKHIRICGLMGMATYTEDEALITTEYKQLKSLFDAVKDTYFRTNDCFSILSMGMSHDYQIAVREGSTMIRIGTDIFGEREY